MVCFFFFGGGGGLGFRAWGGVFRVYKSLQYRVWGVLRVIRVYKGLRFGFTRVYKDWKVR